MSTKQEKIRAQERVEKFLIDLTRASETPKVPKQVRERASMLLRHLATPYEVERGSL
jgi:hypothetical protein